MEEESLDFVRTHHPLPDAIQSMSLEDTVCKYCGISYLIHREVAKLKDEVARLNAELEKTEADRKLFVGMKNEHKLMSDKVSELENLNKNLEHNLEVTKKVSESLSRELAESEKKRTRAAVVFKDKIKTIQTQFIEPLRNEIDCSKTSAQKEIDFLKTFASDAVHQISKTFQEQQAYRHEVSYEETESLKKEFAQNLENAENERKNLSDQINTLQNRLSDGENALRNLNLDREKVQRNYEESTSKCLQLEENLNSAEKKSSNLDSQIQNFMLKNKELEEKVADSTEEVGKLNSEIIKLKRSTLQNEELTRMELDQTKNRAFYLENEMRNLQFELLSKEDLLRNSVPVGDLKDLQEKNERLLQESRSLQSSINNQSSQFDELKKYCSELEESQKKTIENLKAESESKIASLENQLFNLSSRNVDQNRIYDLEEEISIERQKAKTAMELARKEIAAVEERFREVLEEKEQILQKSRSIAQSNEDNQDKNIGNLKAQMLQLTRDKDKLESSLKKAEEQISTIKEDHSAYLEQMNQGQKATEERLATLEEENGKLLETIRKQIDERADLQRTIDGLKDPNAEKEVILLPVTSRLKAASLPPLEKPRSRHEPTRAWPSNSEISGASAPPINHRSNTGIHSSNSAPQIKPPNLSKKSELNLTSIRHRLNAAMNRGKSFR